jgi:hypothetical protein
MQASMYGPVSEFVSQSDYDLILVSHERIEGKLWQSYHAAVLTTNNNTMQLAVLSTEPY